MTDISTVAPKTVRRSGLQQSNIPMLRIGASLAAISALLGDAFNMTYVAPYARHGRRAQAVPDDDLEGRDPSW